MTLTMIASMTVHVGTSIIRIRFWGPSYYNYNKEPQNSIGNYLGPYITLISLLGYSSSQHL